MVIPSTGTGRPGVKLALCLCYLVLSCAILCYLVLSCAIFSCFVLMSNRMGLGSMDFLEQAGCALDFWPGLPFAKNRDASMRRFQQSS